MFDPLLTPAFFLHFAALAGLLAFWAKAWRLPRNDAPFFVLLLLWFDLVVTGHLAGLGGHLGDLAVYVPLSFLSLGLIALFFRPVQILAAAKPLLAPPSFVFAPIESAKTRRFLFWFLAGTLALFAVIVFVIGQCVYPDNADSMIYRLPRAFWYVSNGSFLHPFLSEDKRLVFYPLDGVALYVPFVLYGLPGTVHALPSFLSWGMIVYATYRFARALGADRLIALFPAWIVGMTPSILAQANSTNDEIIAAMALLCSLYMGWRWLVTGRHLYLLLAGLALSLSAGTKLHIVFLMPMVGIVALIALWSLYKKPALLRQWGIAIGGRTAAITFLTVAIGFLPFLFYNDASTGRFYFFDDFKKEVFNLSASLHSLRQNLLIYFSQMIFSPLADLNIWPIANDRQSFNSALNGLLNPLISPFIDADPKLYHLSYRFVGVTLPVSVRFVEFSLWSAFVWLLWPWQAALIAKQKTFSLRSVFLVLALTPLLWLLFWSASTLYMEGTATYFTFYLIVAAPAAVFSFLAIRRPLFNELRWVAVTLVVMTNLIISHNLVMYSGFRALPDLIYAKRLPFDWLLAEDRIVKEIRAAKAIRIVFTHEKMPYFGYMHWNPRAHYYTPYPLKNQNEIPNAQNVLQILPISSLDMYGYMPLKIPGKKTTGLTYLGVVRAIGREALFATGNHVETRYPDESNYIVAALSARADKDGSWIVGQGGWPLGAGPEDQLTFAYQLSQNGKLLFSRPASLDPSFSVKVPVSPYDSACRLTLIVGSALSGKELTRATYDLGGSGAWLPEGNEY